jgi:2-amino-4-hydroxy-6-hydroxymethyldihydropteridine diphosphokinase
MAIADYGLKPSPRVSDKSEIRNPKSEMAWVALGSNLGDSRQIILAAMAGLECLSRLPIHKSSLWQTTPVDCPPNSAKFVNAIVGLVQGAGETPETVLEKLRELEKKFGRQPKKEFNEPRPLDLDLIAFGNEVRNSPELTLPHPRAHQRRFVLQPLSELAPELILPGQTKKISQLLAELPTGEAVTRI